MSLTPSPTCASFTALRIHMATLESSGTRSSLVCFPTGPFSDGQHCPRGSSGRQLGSGIRECLGELLLDALPVRRLECQYHDQKIPPSNVDGSMGACMPRLSHARIRACAQADGLRPIVSCESCLPWLPQAIVNAAVYCGAWRAGHKNGALACISSDSKTDRRS